MAENRSVFLRSLTNKGFKEDRGAKVGADDLLGLANWATGYLGWLPAAGLMPPIWRQKAPQAIVPMAEHALYGMATVVTYNWLRKRF